MRQWDTKKQFKPRYAEVAGVVFLGWWFVIRSTEWKREARWFVDGVLSLLTPISLVLCGLVFLVLSPIAFPVMCLIEKLSQRSRRLDHIRRNRAADRDI